MRFLADESWDVALVKALRDAGNDALEVRLIKPGAGMMNGSWILLSPKAEYS